MMQSIEHAAGSIKRVVAFRLKPGMDVLKGIEEICKAENIKNGVILAGLVVWTVQPFVTCSFEG